MTHKGQNIRIHLRNFTPSKTFAKEIIFGGTHPVKTRLGKYRHLGIKCCSGKLTEMQPLPA